MTKPAYRLEDVATAFQCKPEQDEIISALAERDYRIFEVEQPVGAIVPYHAHDEEEFIVVLNGKMNFNVEEEIVLVQEGEMITIREEAIHSAAPVGEAPAKLLIAFAGDEGDPPSGSEWDADDEDNIIGFA